MSSSKSARRRRKRRAWKKRSTQERVRQRRLSQEHLRWHKLSTALFQVQTLDEVEWGTYASLWEALCRARHVAVALKTTAYIVKPDGHIAGYEFHDDGTLHLCRFWKRRFQPLAQES